MFGLTEQQINELNDQMIDAAVLASPYEMCGALLTNGEVFFVELENSHPDPENYFRICAEELPEIEKKGDILAFVHSHPRGSTAMSALDAYSSHLHNKPFIIVSHDYQVEWHDVPHQAPLVGRDFIPDVLDCYTLIRDYYARELSIDIPDFERTDKWWENEESASLYIEGFPKAGFVQVPKEDLKRHDVLLVRMGDTKHVNHALIYLGDDGTLKSEETPPCIGKTLYLHHLYGKKSVRKILGGELFSRCEYVLRHGDMM